MPTPTRARTRGTLAIKRPGAVFSPDIASGLAWTASLSTRLPLGMTDMPGGQLRNPKIRRPQIGGQCNDHQAEGDEEHLDPRELLDHREHDDLPGDHDQARRCRQEHAP